jgi:signal transduction histidine kinase
MGQLLSNLLANAISYGAMGEPVTVHMSEDPHEVFFSVHNSGHPIPQDEQERIFRPLVRGSVADKQERREPGGLGLGLYICQEIVRSHGGTMAVRSSQATGTSFNVKLPRKAPVPVPDSNDALA